MMTLDKTLCLTYQVTTMVLLTVIFLMNGRLIPSCLMILSLSIFLMILAALSEPAQVAQRQTHLGAMCTGA